MDERIGRAEHKKKAMCITVADHPLHKFCLHLIRQQKIPEDRILCEAEGPSFSEHQKPSPAKQDSPMWLFRHFVRTNLSEYSTVRCC